MKKVVYSVTKLGRNENKLKGIGYLADNDLIIACISNQGKPYIRVFEVAQSIVIYAIIPQINLRARTAKSLKFKSRKTAVLKREKSKSTIISGIKLQNKRRNTMKNKFYLKEFEYFDGESFVKFNIVALYGEKNITLAVSKQGKVTVSEYDLHTDENGLYFEYGIAGREHIYIEDFEEITE